MFAFLLSEEKKMRRHAANWLEVAARVHHYRRDQLSEAHHQRLTLATVELRSRVKERADAGHTKLAIEKLEAVLREVGGRHYPMGSLAENVEFFLVAALVILGLRAYFVQPFKIPTNSMWPTYHGMTHELFREGGEPGLLAKAARLVAFGATNYSVTAPAEGEVLLPVLQASSGQLQVINDEVPGRLLGLFPTRRRVQTFMIGGEPVRLSLPAEFNFNKVLQDWLGAGTDGLDAHLLTQLRRTGRAPESSVLELGVGAVKRQLRVFWLPTGQRVRAGQRFLSFAILTGDLLFVDRISYNFLPPRIGDGFVFKTENIHSLHMQRPDGGQIQQYYIKRLVGAPGDQLEVRTPVLLRNGKPIEGAGAFGANARKDGLYRGYSNYGFLAAGEKQTVPEMNYFAMGDNSLESADSRYWGFIPEKDVVGKPLFIYYPLSRRWGFAR